MGDGFYTILKIEGIRLNTVYLSNNVTQLLNRVIIILSITVNVQP